MARRVRYMPSEALDLADALGEGLDLVKAMSEARRAGAPIADTLAALEDWALTAVNLIEED
ncbi:hypothetical protein Ccr29_gp357 [Caulobacter phage Ccr29]|uniref:Uncharacterized protein n=5 Tax=Viruses TaxID=10239 RepID=J3SL23_9CAUD|nr:hypothetical protein D865_gp014 [Caulobacter phage phiCbK]YP_006988228.1 hypothetical protein D865_gp086 [Caulobacter phage phiCbK]ARB13543.1 hypothetical protein Ccr10_gp015 [Caulobacter phage Ccr10]ARB14572.1 hypothetical protein Ccr29_gp015 [Caulobacter phage Ccr29]ARB14933.1 hypothetical protein Ccr32_gp014 [Caulobacter phage Ccr32]ARB15264.1 hypothetical protein Ccr34_gp015 [Caulobacter phage Ccr34]AFO71822.1 hypothetical protein phiCbK_305 [Caulobacter phage phiCbK]